MRSIPAGELRMGGSPRYGQEDAIDAESLPVHSVRLKPFSLGKYEVTVREFRQFIAATGYQAPQQCIHEPTNNWFSAGPTPGSWDKNALTDSDFQPVVCVGWAAANAYAKWLASETGKPYRLPSEAEWEYAARAGSVGKYYFEENAAKPVVCRHGNVSDREGESAAMKRLGATYLSYMGGVEQCDDGAGFATVVGMYEANPWGLHDMIGNVAEYLQDCWKPGYEDAPSDGRALQTPECAIHALRGGAWHWRGADLRTRDYRPDDAVGGIEGFRLALDGAADGQAAMGTPAFERELAAAQQAERQRRAARLPFPAAPAGLTLSNAADGRIELRWQASAQAGLLGYRVLRSHSAGGELETIANDVQGGRYVDETAPARKHSYAVMAFNRDRLSERSAVVSTADLVHVLPGRVQAEDFNAMADVAVGTIAAMEDADEAQAGLNITGPAGVPKDAWAEYSIEVKTAGRYRLSFRAATLNANAGLSLSLDGQPLATQAFAATGGSRKWQGFAGPIVELPAGRHQLRLLSLEPGWKLNWLAFEPG
ncbi:SUMF1/EgtB/PvdO family nonheme iron enzyme [Paucibacter sp. APW11]|uniref:SUMF1/EgtB/PvdO family nonheme iron enzyme n=1 Tax=Roseateles aquae TaxID=3077235 RepID=A0ABU3PHH5_9BURK|nr:SUMF1/EgtB/PvdO family nonheme iron enzyme [Paucibacter sp. APW11]MDT9002016.1 SUMF1/EgtB/PvdO family nonheme iron enzyme [Paucibacter sp. APW11]